MSNRDYPDRGFSRVGLGLPVLGVRFKCTLTGRQA